MFFVPGSTQRYFLLPDALVYQRATRVLRRGLVDGTRPVTFTLCAGVVPQVTHGSIVSADTGLTAG